jgi:hypothetical protein
MKRALLLSTVFLGLTGCAGAYVVRYGPPPPPRYAVMGYAPGPGYVWCEGSWAWRGSRWEWVAGRWMRPPRPRAAWVPGAWVAGHGGWHFRSGYWR